MMTMYEVETICKYLGYKTYAYGTKTLNARAITFILVKVTEETNRKITPKQLLPELGV